MKQIINQLAGNFGLEIRRKPDASLPILHTFRAEGDQLSFWIADSSTKSWWLKPERPIVGEFAELKRICRPGDTVVEVGCHHGMMSLLMSRWVQQHGVIHSIEANAYNAMVHQANCAANRLTNVTTTLAAMGEKAGTVSFAGESLAVHDQAARTVSMRTLDEFCETLKLTRLDVLKVDVEGYEKSVFDGGRATLARFRPRLALELHIDDLQAFGQSARVVWDQVRDAGLFEGRTITMMARPDWEKIVTIKDFADLPTSGVVNLFSQ